ncbi:MAG: hypothetical protein V4726_17575 [Verrucomicrobiota bacterium]
MIIYIIEILIKINLMENKIFPPSLWVESGRLVGRATPQHDSGRPGEEPTLFILQKGSGGTGLKIRGILRMIYAVTRPGGGMSAFSS